MVGQRRKRWATINPALGQCRLFPGFALERGGGPRVLVSTAAFHARVRGSVPGLGGSKMFLPHPRVKVSIVGSLRDREVACSASDRQGSNFESYVWRTVSSQSSHHLQEVLLAQFSLYVYKGGLKPDSFHLLWKDKQQWLLNPSPDITVYTRVEASLVDVRLWSGACAGGWGVRGVLIPSPWAADLKKIQGIWGKHPEPPYFSKFYLLIPPPPPWQKAAHAPKTIPALK